MIFFGICVSKNISFSEFNYIRKFRCACDLTFKDLVLRFSKGLKQAVYGSYRLNHFCECNII